MRPHSRADDLDGRQPSDYESGGLQNITNSTVLGLWNNSLSDISPLWGLTNLTILNLDSNPISDHQRAERAHGPDVPRVP